jgi:D-alanyl-D-alanine carboxypeptidase
MGFQRAPKRVAVRKPARPPYIGHSDVAGKTIRLVRTVQSSPRPRARPVAEPPQELLVAMQDEIQQAVTEANTAAAAAVDTTPPPRPTVAEAEIDAPKPRPAELRLASVETAPQQPEVVTRMSSSGGRHWGINVGRYPTRYQAERMLLSTALQELGALDEALRKVVQNSRGFEANFVGMTREQAALACRRLEARGADCSTFGPKS